MPVITLTTDFGTADGYVGAMKGVILTIAPGSQIVDLSHEVAPQDILGGSFVLSGAHRYFPEGTIHVAVVDPGVGTARRAVVVASKKAIFVAPDNGILTFALADYGCRAQAGDRADQGTAVASRLPLRMANLPAQLRAVALTDAHFWLPDPSATFHGRDIFAPVAAHLATGVSLSAVGKPISSVALYVLPSVTIQPDGAVLVTVVHVDHFGNLITNAVRADIPFPSFFVAAAGRRVPLLSTYAAGEDLLALFGSTGRLEMAKRDGNAAVSLGLGVGSVVTVRADDRTGGR